MVKRGPKTHAEYQADSVIIPGQREPAPEDLEPEAAALWDAIIVRLPAEWFTTESRPMLKAYCRHSHYADIFANMIREHRALIALVEADIGQGKKGVKILPGLYERLHELHKMHGYETKQALDCATKLRLTNQSRYVRDVAASKARSNTTHQAPAWHSWADDKHVGN